MKNSQTEKLLTPKDASIYLGLSIGTLAVWRTTGRHELPFIKIGGRVRYKVEDLDNWVTSRTKTITE